LHCFGRAKNIADLVWRTYLWSSKCGEKIFRTESIAVAWNAIPDGGANLTRAKIFPLAVPLNAVDQSAHGAVRVASEVAPAKA